jgi:hypothetical protein
MSEYDFLFEDTSIPQAPRGIIDRPHQLVDYWTRALVFWLDNIDQWDYQTTYVDDESPGSQDEVGDCMLGVYAALGNIGDLIRKDDMITMSPALIHDASDCVLALLGRLLAFRTDHVKNMLTAVARGNAPIPDVEHACDEAAREIRQLITMMLQLRICRDDFPKDSDAATPTEEVGKAA